MEVSGFNLYAIHRFNKHLNAKRDSGGICCYVRNNLDKYLIYIAVTVMIFCG